MAGRPISTRVAYGVVASRLRLAVSRQAVKQSGPRAHFDALRHSSSAGPERSFHERVGLSRRTCFEETAAGSGSRRHQTSDGDGAATTAECLRAPL
jgi:hypothetical protein